MKLDELLDEFDGLDPEERLELLIDWASSLPPLAPEFAALKEAGQCRVHECQTFVFLWVGVENGRVQVAGWVPEKSPTVRGYIALLIAGLSGEPAEAVLRLPDDIVSRLGLRDALGMTRARGFQGIITRIKREVARLSAQPSAVAAV